MDPTSTDPTTGFRHSINGDQPELAIMRTALWTGVAKAGYSASEELPVFAMIFLIPAVVALVCRSIL
jgi:hypothetical protein